ncbi:cyclic nucleotide-gated ion channel 4-like [Typha angustifolia]|uniref:cyclic nucleotide-gated ion channel 4-like n=1 Tax=Typha angustifolia TaxID=59011 RepID=UPI003C2FCACE
MFYDHLETTMPGAGESTYTPYEDMGQDVESDEEGSSHAPRLDHVGVRRGQSWLLGGVLDPQSRWVQEWNRTFLLVCAAGLVVDPLFFYALSISGAQMCLFVDGWFAVTVTVLRCMTDAVHVWNMWVRLKTAYRNRRSSTMSHACEEVVEGVISMMSSREVALEYLTSTKGFFFDLFIIFPVPQVVLWVAAPALIRRGSTIAVMTIFLIMFLIQYLPKIYHSICFLRRLQNSSGYIFGTIWWGITLNLIAYFVGAHAVGACWYLLGIQRATRCLNDQCISTKGCGLRTVGCLNPVYYSIPTASSERERMAWAHNLHARTTCLNSQDNYDYGNYKWTLLLVMNSSRLEKMLLPIFWGLMNITTFGGGLQSTTELLEIFFNIIVVTTGLLLVTMLIGNIKVFLHSTTSKKQALHLKMRRSEWWMKRKQLPKGIKQRVRQYERQRWAAMRGVDEGEMIQNLPEGLRRDIKYHLCLDLVRQVPLFQHMDELVLENICDRVKSFILPKGETISREGDPVQRMLFIVRGHLQSSQVLRDGVKSCCMLGPGNFSGDELLSWCLRRPFIERLPPSSSTLVTLESTEAFGLEAGDLRYVTQHFRYTFVNEKVKRSARYYSPGWRTWAAVAIQMSWKRYKSQGFLARMAIVRARRPTEASRCASPGEERLRHYAALLTSPKPQRDALS